MRFEHVWWLVNPTTKQVIAAYEDVRAGTLRELTLRRCVAVWGWDPPEAADDGNTSGAVSEASSSSCWKRVAVKGRPYTIPRVPGKYVKFLKARRSVYREIAAMAALDRHPNILVLHEVLELVEDSKDTLFLVLEMATGGELFDRCVCLCACVRRCALCARESTATS